MEWGERARDGRQLQAKGARAPSTLHVAQLWDHRRDAREPRVILPGLCQPPHRRSSGGGNGSKPALAASRSTESPSLKDAVNPQPAPSSCSTAHGPTRHPAARWVFLGTSPARQHLSSLLVFHFRTALHGPVFPSRGGTQGSAPPAVIKPAKTFAAAQMFNQCLVSATVSAQRPPEHPLACFSAKNQPLPRQKHSSAVRMKP